jgi:hypothetical protein
MTLDGELSKPVDGVAETLIKSKKYVAILGVLSPGVTAGLVVAYLTTGRLQHPKAERVVAYPNTDGSDPESALAMVLAK